MYSLVSAPIEGSVYERNIRNVNSLNVYIPKPNVEYYWKSFKYAHGKIWNSVPNNIHNVPSLGPD